MQLHLALDAADVGEAVPLVVQVVEPLGPAALVTCDQAASDHRHTECLALDQNIQQEEVCWKELKYIQKKSCYLVRLQETSKY